MRAWTYFIVLALLCGCGAPASNISRDEVAATYAAAFDKGKEARAWMAAGNSHMFEASDETTNQVIAELYSLGAVDVRVTDASKLTEESPGETAATLMAKLPQDDAKRKKLFDYERENTELADENQSRDYIEIVFD